MTDDIQSSSLAKVRALLPELAQYGVVDVWLFGSRASGQASTQSDWDILVEFRDPPDLEQFMDLKFHLEERLEGKVDLLSKTACKNRFMRTIESSMLHVA